MYVVTGRMSDHTRLAQSDELQSEFESAERRRSSCDVTDAVDAAGLAAGSPRRLVRSYNRQAVEQGQEMPPRYGGEYRTGEVSSQQQQQQQQPGWQQSAGCGDYPRQINTAYNQFQQQAARPTSTVVRLTDDDQQPVPMSTASAQRRCSPPLALRLAIVVPVFVVCYVIGYAIGYTIMKHN